eukprot:scaffold188422_cov21-Tisochrysis_lutea.AAC.4
MQACKCARATFCVHSDRDPVGHAHYCLGNVNGESKTYEAVVRAIEATVTAFVTCMVSILMGDPWQASPTCSNLLATRKSLAEVMIASGIIITNVMQEDQIMLLSLRHQSVEAIQAAHAHVHEAKRATQQQNSSGILSIHS